MENNTTNISNTTFLADWLEGKIDDAKLKELVSEEDFHVFLKIKKTMENYEKPTFDLDLGFENLLKKNQKQKQTKIRKIFPNWVYAVAATIVLFFGISYFTNSSTTLTTGFGEKNQIVLNDGSKVQLNSKSKLRYSNKAHSNRELYLEGEAFFEVTKGDRFSVETPQGTISVLGTEFNVISRNGFFEVICYEGKVQVEYNKKNVILTAGKAFRLVDKVRESRWKIETSTSTWLQGETSFQSVQIKNVFQAMENEFQVEIDDSSINTAAIFTGSFSNTDIETALKTVCLPLGIQFDLKDNNKIVLSN